MRPVQALLFALILLAAIPTPVSVRVGPAPPCAAATPVDARATACEDARSPLGLVLGITDQAAFEARNGPPGDTSSATDPAIGTIYDLVGDFETVQIVWIDRRPARIQLLPFEELTEAVALDLALAFLPDLTRESVAPTRVAGRTGIARFTGNSPTLADATDPDWYDAFDPSARPGDISITLYPGTDHIAVIDLALGTGPAPIDE